MIDRMVSESYSPIARLVNIDDVGIKINFERFHQILPRDLTMFNTGYFFVNVNTFLIVYFILLFIIYLTPFDGCFGL